MNSPDLMSKKTPSNAATPPAPDLGSGAVVCSLCDATPETEIDLPDDFGKGGLPELPFDKLYRELAESRAREEILRVALTDTVDRLRAEGHGDDPKDLQHCWQCSLHNRNKAALEYPTAENTELT